MKLLVTGASGLIGRQVAALALQNPAIDLVATARKRPEGLDETANFIPADLSNAEEAGALVRSIAPTHIIHGAWETRQPTYWEDMANIDWIAATAKMADSFAAVGGRRFVQLGTVAEYEWNGQSCVEDRTPSHPSTRYGKAKLAAFAAIEAAAHRCFEAVEARIFSVFGPGENAARFIPHICLSHLAGIVPKLGSGAQQRDLLHSTDAARGLLTLAAAEGLCGVVNVASGEPVLFSDVAAKLAQMAGAAETGLGARPDRLGEPSRLVASADRIRSLGWRPLLTLDEGLARTLDWWSRKNTREGSTGRV